MNGTESLDLVLVDEIFLITYKHLLSTCYILGMIVNVMENIKHEELMIFCHKDLVTLTSHLQNQPNGEHNVVW